MTRGRRLIRAAARAAAAAWAAVIWYLSSLPAPPVPPGVPDYVGHALEYGLLAALLWGATGGLPAPWARWRAGGIVLLCALYGSTDEIHQGFVPGRDPSLADLAADAAGAAAASGALWAFASLSRRRAGAAPALTLLSRADCPLCDEAEAVLIQVQKDTPFRYTKVDVDSDESLRREFGEEVPVVLMGGRKVFKFHVDADRLRRRLRAAGGGWERA